MTHVKVTKLTRLPDRPNGDLVTADGFIPIEEGYWVRGYANEMPTIGKPFIVDRHERNGVQMRGEFSTSKVEAVESKDGHIEIRTVNSIYRVDQLNP